MYGSIVTLHPVLRLDEEFIILIKKMPTIPFTSTSNPKYMVKLDTTADWQIFHDPILHLDIEEGFEYTIKLNKRLNMLATAHSSPYVYECLEVMDKVKIRAQLTGIQTFLGKHTWKLLQLYGEKITENQPTLSFDWKISMLNGYTGCNQMFTSVTIDDQYIYTEPISTSLRICKQEELENKFLSLFKEGYIRFDVAEQTLNLYHDKKLVAIFGIQYPS